MATARTPLSDAEEATATEGVALAAPGADATASTAPDAEAIASRAVMIAALLERARLESARDDARHEALQRWVQRSGVLGHLGPEGVALFEARPGAWAQDDVDTVGWAAEELQVLLWALSRASFPPRPQRVQVEPLLRGVPLLQDPAPFIDSASRRPLEDVELQLALCQTVLEAVRCEVYARAITEDPASLQRDDELEALLRDIEQRGFARAEAARQGHAQDVVQGLRFWSRVVLEELFDEDGPHHAQRIDPAALGALAEVELATWLACLQARFEALAWLMAGEDDAGEA